MANTRRNRTACAAVYTSTQIAGGKTVSFVDMLQPRRHKGYTIGPAFGFARDPLPEVFLCVDHEFFKEAT